MPKVRSLLFKDSMKVIIFSLLFSLLVSGCAHFNEEPPPPPPPQTKSVGPLWYENLPPRSQKLSDAVNAVLKIANANRVRAVASDETGYVALFGSVPSEEFKRELLTVVKSVAGVRSINDEIAVIASADQTAGRTPAAAGSLWSGVSDQTLFLLVLGLALGAFLWWARRRGFRFNYSRPSSGRV
jgi:hypothetical protein